MERVDFCVLGGGPAGLAFATLAARAGARVIVAERTRYDRPRPGEHLAGAIRPALAQLGVPRAAAAAILEQSPGIVVAWGTQLPVTKSYAGHPAGTAFNADRRGFDRLLGDTAAAAGAICMPAARLAEATPVAGQSWQIRLATAAGPRAIAAGLVIDASGRRAAFARRQGAARRRAGDLVALTTWYAAEGRRAAAQPLVVAAGGAGWWSLTATPDQGYAATFYTSADLLRRSHGKSADGAAAVSQSAPVVANRIARAAAVALGRQTFACCPQVTVPMHGPGWIAVGEAAAAFDPICGQGVVYALETAFRAFEASVAGPALARLGPEYEAALRERIDDHLTGRRRVYSEAVGRLDAEFLERACFPGFA